MTKDECYIGARVVLNVDHPDGNRNLVVGDKGNIVYIGTQNGDGLRIGVEWDKEGVGHDCDGNAARKHGWYIYAKYASFAIENEEENICVDSSLIDDLIFN